jgi:hypothetical protein
MSPDVPLEEEYIPLFRKSLAAVADPVAAAAAIDGEVVYLGTVEFRQGYLEFCDDFIASNLPTQHRARMREHRDAIRPYVGRRVLRGGVRHAGRHYEAYIDLATGAVIDLAWGPWPPPGLSRQGTNPAERGAAAERPRD